MIFCFIFPIRNKNTIFAHRFTYKKNKYNETADL